MKRTRISIVVSDFNPEITQVLLKGAHDTLLKKGVLRENITVVHVPGAIEIPFTIQALAKHKNYQAIIALGAVIQGETDHYRAVCDYVTAGCREVNLAYHVPLVFGVLMTQTEAQARDRIGGAHGHKGVEAAETALAMIDMMKKIT